MKKIFASLIITLLAVTACKKDDTICYNNITMANIVDGSLVSDQGNTFDIMDAQDILTPENFKYDRAILVCDVLKKTAEKRYDIRLKDIESVLAKEPVPAEAIKPEDEINVDDPIHIRDIWYGGGYINMLLEFAAKTNSDTKHLINLIFSEVAEPAEGSQVKNHTFTLRHNAFGEVATEENSEQYTISGGYVSFPVAHLIDGDEADITLNWNSYKLEGGWLSIFGSEAKSKTFNWKRIGYEHPQKSSIVTPAAACLE